MTENFRDISFRVSLLPEVGIDFITPSIELLTGYSPQQFYTQPSLIRQILNEQDYSILLSFVNAPGLSGDLVAVKVRRHDSSWTWIAISVVLIRDGRGCVTAVEGIGHDVSTWNKMK
jgi:two-component system, sporulation sensor kinase C